jgi:3D-(3,5/4)-trihydroxycyclohexane-1,2-dione acylhydrolase (decyclizing)
VATVRLTVAQALVRFLAAQHSERDGQVQRLIPGCFGIFGHGNVAGVGQALLEAHVTRSADLPYYLARNEQAMVHAAVGFARMRNRLQALACTASIGPGSTNMVTGAALATINRIPVLLLPSDYFATRAASPLLQELEDPRSFDVSVNDAFKPVSRYWDRINRPEQLPSALLAAMRVLTDPAEAGAVTLALPQDVQAEAHDWPEELFAERVWRVARPMPEPAALHRAAAVLKSARRPLIVAGAPGAPAANALATDADVVLGVGTRYSDFTTASRTVFADPQVRFVNLNVTGFDAGKHAATALVADARAGLEALKGALDGYRTSEAYQTRARELSAAWQQQVDRAYHLGHQPKPGQTEVIGALNEFAGDRDVVVQAAGSMPGDLQRLWRARDPKAYHVEYGYSCMGYEIAGGLGAKLADPSREVFVLVGDGSYLMMAQEIVTAIAERIKLVIVIVQNHGFASIGSLSESVGSQRFGTAYRYRNPQTGLLDGDLLPVDLAANAASLGADVLRARTVPELRDCLKRARAAPVTTVVHIETDPLAPAPSSGAWWDVPVAQTAALDSTRQAHAAYQAAKGGQRPYL